MYKENWVLDNIKWLIFHKTKPNQTKPNQTDIVILSFS